jgi:hypothetical protein
VREGPRSPHESEHDFPSANVLDAPSSNACAPRRHRQDRGQEPPRASELGASHRPRRRFPEGCSGGTGFPALGVCRRSLQKQARVGSAV